MSPFMRRSEWLPGVYQLEPIVGNRCRLAEVSQPAGACGLGLRRRGPYLPRMQTEHTQEDPATRRARIVDQRRAETGIDEAMIDRLVRRFYGRVRLDPTLGPIFEARVEDWEDHFRRLGAFWSSVTLGTGAYSGTPMQKHMGLPADGRHFDIWLRLFAETAAETCPAEAATLFIERALRIAESLELAIAADLGHMLGKGERLARPDAEVHLPAV
jgi:hemoglobin